jgi:glucosamine kinase
MMLIADSGSTKTDWSLVSEGDQTGRVKTMGFNPYFQSTADIAKELRDVLAPQLDIERGTDLEIFFYGAGCSSEAKCQIVSDAIAQVFPGANIEVEHDLLAAARALCGKEEGVAAILGTGSNSCYYDGEKIREHVFSLGFIMGDEGSGAYLGKKLLQFYLYGELPSELKDKFAAQYPQSREEILDSVYKKPLPSRYLASFSRFLHDNLSHVFIEQLVFDAFDDFFAHHICKYSRYREVPFSCVGSIGYRYSSVLKKVAGSKGVRMGKIIESPIEALTAYHLALRGKKA